MTTRVLVADDHGAIRSGLVLMLGNADGIEVVGEAADGEAAIRQSKALRPDVVLMDVRMPGTDGIAATAAITGEGLAQVLVLTTFDIDEYVYSALRSGAAGFLLKSVESAKLVEAIRLVAAGEGVLDPQITRKLITAFAATQPSAPSAPSSELNNLTAREYDVLVCLGNGQSNAEIGRALYIGETTVKTHVSRVLTKLNFRSRVQAAIFAQEAGLANESDR